MKTDLIEFILKDHKNIEVLAQKLKDKTATIKRIDTVYYIQEEHK